MTVPQQTNNMTTIFNCADCRKAIKENSREHDDCWTNMEKDDDLWYCGDCKGDHMDDEEEEESVCDDEQRSYGARGAPAPESDDDEEECDCCGKTAFSDTDPLITAEDAEGNEEKYCVDCLLLKIDDGCVWQVASGEWAC
jgi:hypothetical protein